MSQPNRSGRRRGRPPVSGPALASRQAAVLAAAARLVGETPPAELSVEQVIRAAGTSRPTFYRWFPGGLAQVMDRLMAEAHSDLLERILQAAALDAPVEERISQGIACYFDWAREAGPLARAIYRDGFDPQSASARYRHRVLAAVHRIFLEQAGELGLHHVTPMMVETLVGWIESAMSALMQHYPVSTQQAAQQAGFTADMVLGVLGRLRQSATPPSI